jgi:8-oxo-dGTP diphosphatase / 2-hydroxy-dATP diphosphatase
MKKVLTLCIPTKNEQVLLGMKKRGFGVGRWNGFGGKIEDCDKSIEAAAKREIYEEVGIADGTLENIGCIQFSFQSEENNLEVHIFKLTNFETAPVETEEMLPQWFYIDTIPFDQMWPDDRFWFPYLLENKKFMGTFLLDRPSDAAYSSKIIAMSLEEVLHL